MVVHNAATTDASKTLNLTMLRVQDDAGMVKAWHADFPTNTMYGSGSFNSMKERWDAYFARSVEKAAEKGGRLLETKDLEFISKEKLRQTLNAEGGYLFLGDKEGLTYKEADILKEKLEGIFGCSVSITTGTSRLAFFRVQQELCIVAYEFCTGPPRLVAIVGASEKSKLSSLTIGKLPPIIAELEESAANPKTVETLKFLLREASEIVD